MQYHHEYWMWQLVCLFLLSSRLFTFSIRSFYPSSTCRSTNKTMFTNNIPGFTQLQRSAKRVLWNHRSYLTYLLLYILKFVHNHRKMLLISITECAKVQKKVMFSFSLIFTEPLKCFLNLSHCKIHYNNGSIFLPDNIVGSDSQVQAWLCNPWIMSKTRQNSKS